MQQNFKNGKKENKDTRSAKLMQVKTSMTLTHEEAKEVLIRQENKINAFVPHHPLGQFDTNNAFKKAYCKIILWELLFLKMITLHNIYTLEQILNLKCHAHEINHISYGLIKL